MEMQNLKIDAIQNALTQILQNQQPVSSPVYEHSHGEHSNSEQQWQHRSQQRRVNFEIPRFDGTEALGWIFAVDQYFDFFKVPKA